MANVRVTDEKISDIADSIRQKKNESTQYTLDEMKSEIDTLSSPQGKTITFRNLDESGGQKFIVTKTLADSELEGSSQDLVVDPPDIKYNFYLRCQSGYYPGNIDHDSPINYNDFVNNEIVTAQPGYVITSDGRQLVDMSNYLTDNPDMFDNNFHITEFTKDYFKSVSPTNLTNAFSGRYLPGPTYEYIDYNTFMLLDMSHCASLEGSFLNFGSSYSYKQIILNLSGWDIKNVTNINKCFGNLYWTELDITGWDTSSVTSANNFLNTVNALDQNKIHGLESLNFSNCESLEKTLDFYSLNNAPLEYLDLQKWKVSNKCKNIYGIFYHTQAKIIDITGWDTSGVTNFQYMMRESPCTELRGVLDMASAVQSWQGYSNMVKGENLQVPIKIKNPPSASDWWQKAGFTSEDQFEIVT